MIDIFLCLFGSQGKSVRQTEEIGREQTCIASDDGVQEKGYSNSFILPKPSCLLLYPLTPG